MRLWRRNEAPVGGWYYIIEGLGRVPQAGFATGLEPLVDQVVVRMEAAEMEVPAYIAELVEDQICTRQPPDKCRYSKKLGDVLAQGIHAVAGAVDMIAGTSLQPRARRCGKCGGRRVKMNNL